MNTSQFMDKQIMDLSNLQSNSDFIDLMNPQEGHIGGGKKEEIVASYDFQPIRPIAAAQQSNIDSDHVGGARVWNSADSKKNTTATGIRSYSSLDSVELAKVVPEKDHNANTAALVSEIDQAMKKHADTLLHALEGVSARISQLETRTRHLENSMDDLKVSVGNNHGSMNGKLRQLENILGEVQAGVRVISDKQDIIEGQLHLAKLQASKVEQQPKTHSTEQSDTYQNVASALQPSHIPLPPPSIVQPPSTLSPPNAPPPASQQFLPPVQVPHPFPPNQVPSVPQREHHFPPSQPQEPTNQQYQLPPPQQLQPPVPAPPQQQYQPPPHPHYSQPPLPPPPQQHPSFSAVNPPPQPQPPLGHHLDEAPPYAPPQNYPPSLRQPSHPPTGNPPSQQFYGAPPPVYEPPSNRPNPGYSTAYGPSSGTNEPYSHGGSASQYGGGVGGGSASQYGGGVGGGSASQYGGGGGGSSYAQLPTARILPQALPTASGVSDGSGSSGTGNRVPIDDVVDKVTNMGFPRDQVRAMVRKLTENGQSVDLNIVLDKLMNEGDGQPPRGWFGR